jgi:hypothetical protein
MTLPRAWRRIRRVKHGFACALTLHFTISRCPALTGIAYHPWRRSIIARRREWGAPTALSVADVPVAFPASKPALAGGDNGGRSRGPLSSPPKPRTAHPALYGQ